MEGSGSRQRRSRRTGAGPRCCSPKAQSLRRSRRAVRAHGEDSEGRAAAVAPSETMRKVSGGEPPATVPAHRRGPPLRQSEGAILAAILACSPSPRGGQRGMQSDSSSPKTLCGADDGGERQPPATVTAPRRGPALRQSEGVILAAIPACSPSPRGGQPGMICGGSPTETPRRVGSGGGGSRRRRSRRSGRTGAGPRCGRPRAQSLRRSLRAVRAHEEDSEGCRAAVAPRRPCGGLTVGKAASASGVETEV